MKGLNSGNHPRRLCRLAHDAGLAQRKFWPFEAAFPAQIMLPSGERVLELIEES
jgi:hypothetical protein